jgi:hypothetical protein
MNLKKLERYLRVNLSGPGPRLIKKEFTGPRSHKSCVQQEEDSLYQQIGLKFEEETSKMLHLEHGFVWC